ncbi:hypothetical protein FUA39_02260 [Salmonella enterica]|nr:hypothetical protein [Salmonella enterica]ECP5831987.1 hypothetical protein [Salmonella enterica]ECZ7353835.1 hypothetical protein [Salmonella enterica]EFR3984503.1 hypothetical protein [Salmonella enterica]EID4166476.1 hypothetical protein [Salmonella enterica]
MVKIELIFTSQPDDTSVPGVINTAVQVEFKATGLDTPPVGPAHLYGQIAMHKKREILKLISDEFIRVIEARGDRVINASLMPVYAGNHSVN